MEARIQTVVQSSAATGGSKTIQVKEIGEERVGTSVCKTCQRPLPKKCAAFDVERKDISNDSVL